MRTALRLLLHLPLALAFPALAHAQALEWIQHPGNGHWYGRSEQTGTWNGAHGLAHDWGGELVTIRSASENDWIVASFPPGFDDVWIGLHDTCGGGIGLADPCWDWVSGEPVTYLHPNLPTCAAYIYAYKVRLRNTGAWFGDESGRGDLSALVEIQSGDCNANAVPDIYEARLGLVADCNSNGTPDSCDVGRGGVSLDCNANLVPDECEGDCNGNAIPDDCDIASGNSPDCNGNGVVDECETDCNQNGVPDDCDIGSGSSADCNSNGIPDECDIHAATSRDCNLNVVPDECEFAPLVFTEYCFCSRSTDTPCGNFLPSSGCENSTGTGSRLDPCGSSSVAADDLTLTATFLPTNQFGLVFMGAGQVQFPFGNGQLCVSTGGVGQFRYEVRFSSTAGSFTEGPGMAAHSAANFGIFGTISLGQTWNFQAWYRDPGGPCGSTFNLSSGLAVTFGP